MISSKERLASARQTLGKSPEEIAFGAGINLPSCYDLENVDDEIESAISLGTLKKICAELGVSISDLFADVPIVHSKKISPDQIASRIKKEIENSHITLSEFERRAGFRVGGFLDDPSTILEMDVECVRSICNELSIDWLLALP